MKKSISIYLTVLLWIFPNIIEIKSQTNSQIKIISQLGHLSEILIQKSSPKNTYQATSDEDFLIIIKNQKNNFDLFRFYGHQSKITTLEFSPDEKLLFSGCIDGTFKVWDLIKGEEIHSNKGAKSYNANKWKLGIAKLFSSKKVKSSKLFDSIHSISIDPIMEYLVVNSTAGIKLYDYKSYEFLGWISLNESGNSKNVYFDNDRNLYYSEKVQFGSYITYKIDFKTHEKIRLNNSEKEITGVFEKIKRRYTPKKIIHSELYFNEKFNLGFGIDRFIYELNFKNLNIHTVHSFDNEILSFKYNENFGLTGVLKKDNSLLITKKSNDFNEKNLFGPLDRLEDFQFGENFPSLHIIVDHYVCEFDFLNEVLNCSAFYDIVPIRKGMDGVKKMSSIKMSQKQNDMVYYMGTNNGIVIWNKGKGKVKRIMTRTPLYYHNAFSNLSTKNWEPESNITTLKISNDGNYLICGIGDGSLHAKFLSKVRKKRWTKGHNSRVTDLIYVDKEESVISGSEDGSILKWNFKEKEDAKNIGDHHSGILDIHYDKETNLVSSLGKDGTIKLWKIDNDSFVELIQIFFYDNKKYSIVTPDGYYFNSQDFFPFFLFRNKNQIFQPEQFDLKLNRPDIILGRLGFANKNTISLFNKAYIKRLQKLNFTEDMLSPDAQIPEINLINKPSITETDVSELNLQIEATDTKQNLDRLNIWINDVPIYGINGIKLRDKNTQTWRQNLTLPLSRGENKIQVSTLNQGGAESLKETIYITYDAPHIKPNLYLIGIAANDFPDDDLDLKYPKKDIDDFFKLYQNQSNKYESIITKTLYNNEISKKGLQKIKETLNQSKVDDQVILFVAGHGVLDDSLDYYLGTPQMDFNNPSDGGILYEDLENLLDGIPARQKLFLMDACHSGEIDKEEMEIVENDLATKMPNKKEGIIFRSRSSDKIPQAKNLGLDNSFELMKQLFVDLRRGTGATVISSAGGGEFAWEGDRWQNSVFTYCLLTGLKDRKADANDDGQIMVSELRDYLQKEVPNLTGNHQQPTMRMENISNDWRVW